jgi:hypothetical protein
MSDRMWADPVGLRDTQPHLRLLTSAVAGTLARLGAALDAEGPCWGADQMGEAFGTTYAPAAQQVRAAWARLHDGLSGVGDALGLAADNVDGAENRAQARLS